MEDWQYEISALRWPLLQDPNCMEAYKAGEGYGYYQGFKEAREKERVRIRPTKREIAIISISFLAGISVSLLF